MSLEERVKALEDWQQALARVFLAPPQKNPDTPMREAQKSVDPLVCPLCGGKKKAEFKQCFSCYEKAHPK